MFSTLKAIVEILQNNIKLVMEPIKMILIKNSRRVFDIREYVGPFIRLWKNNDSVLVILLMLWLSTKIKATFRRKDLSGLKIPDE